jgi:outer membrane lipopolysaccharide assembly protein LptE/RlpB
VRCPAAAGRALLLLLLLGAVAAAAGCGYRIGPADPIRGARTVQVPIFENRTFRRGVETDLARQIASEMNARNRIRIVEAGGDLVVEGVITEIREAVLSLGEDQAIRESSVAVTVEVTVRDGRSGAAVVPLRKITEREPFVPSIGESLRTARAEALRRLAADVADLLEEDGPSGIGPGALPEPAPPR